MIYIPMKIKARRIIANRTLTQFFIGNMEGDRKTLYHVLVNQQKLL